ncbi:hypothetical protein Tco_0196618 [Tanacetum coccineum]
MAFYPLFSPTNDTPWAINRGRISRFFISISSFYSLNQENTPKDIFTKGNPLPKKKHSKRVLFGSCGGTLLLFIQLQVSQKAVGQSQKTVVQRLHRLLSAGQRNKSFDKERCRSEGYDAKADIGPTYDSDTVSRVPHDMLENVYAHGIKSHEQPKSSRDAYEVPSGRTSNALSIPRRVMTNALTRSGLIHSFWIKASATTLPLQDGSESHNHNLRAILTNDIASCSVLSN